MNALLAMIGVDLPIIQAPMAGTATPAMAAAVSNAGALGSIGVGPVGVEAARRMKAACTATPGCVVHSNMCTSSGTKPALTMSRLHRSLGTVW